MDDKPFVEGLHRLFVDHFQSNLVVEVDVDFGVCDVVFSQLFVQCWAIVSPRVLGCPFVVDHDIVVVDVDVVHVPNSPAIVAIVEDDAVAVGEGGYDCGFGNGP